MKRNYMKNHTDYITPDVFSVSHPYYKYIIYKVRAWVRALGPIGRIRLIRLVKPIRLVRQVRLQVEQLYTIVTIVLPLLYNIICYIDNVSKEKLYTFSNRLYFKNLYTTYIEKHNGSAKTADTVNHTLRDSLQSLFNKFYSTGKKGDMI